MIYPFLPIFLTVTLHAPVAVIGLIFGVAEASANFSKLFFGWLSDKLGKRKLFIVSGYGLSAIEKVLMGISTHWGFVMLARSADRFGKGMRVPARDALIAENAPTNGHGRSFGLHRTLDSIGAVVGPLIGLFLLWLFAYQLRPIFFFTIIPSALCIFLLATFIHDPKITPNGAGGFSWGWVKDNTPFMHFLFVTGVLVWRKARIFFLFLNLTILVFHSLPASWLTFHTNLRKHCFRFLPASSQIALACARSSCLAIFCLPQFHVPGHSCLNIILCGFCFRCTECTWR